MPLESPEESARATRRLQLGCGVAALLVTAFLAGLALWQLINGTGIGPRGWLFLVAFALSAIGFVRLLRRTRPR